MPLLDQTFAWKSPIANFYLITSSLLNMDEKLSILRFPSTPADEHCLNGFKHYIKAGFLRFSQPLITKSWILKIKEEDRKPPKPKLNIHISMAAFDDNFDYWTPGIGHALCL